MKYKKRPVVIDAIQNTLENEGLVNNFLSEAPGVMISRNFHTGRRSITFRTLEGDMKCEDGDWIIRGVKGEFYPCKPDIFDLTYELVKTT